jgi:hypothetical protein
MQHGAPWWALYRMQTERHLGASVGLACVTHANPILRPKASWPYVLWRPLRQVLRRYKCMAGAAKPKSCRIVRASGANSIIPLWPSRVSTETN